MKFPLRTTHVLALIVLAVWGGNARLWAASAEEDWQAVVALDAGPQGNAKSGDAATALVHGHLARQEKTLRSFLAAHPQDGHVFEAQLRLSRLLQIRADLEGSDKLRAEARQLLDNLEKTATAEQRPEVEFARIAWTMRQMKGSEQQQREALLAAARRFQADYPGDRRVAGLLTEVATLFDNEAGTKLALLEDAEKLATNPNLKDRIADDLKRVRLVGQPVPLHFTSIQGQEVNVETPAGRPVFVFFFAQASAPAMAALGKFQQELAQLPAGSVGVVGVNLDMKRDVVVDLLKARHITWPVAWDGKSWESPLVRNFGINALPTVWLLDGHGRLRSLNALDKAAAKARDLMSAE
jgi:hypothetical protein